jgi:hypothetical protein
MSPERFVKGESERTAIGVPRHFPQYVFLELSPIENGFLHSLGVLRETGQSNQKGWRMGNRSCYDSAAD